MRAYALSFVCLTVFVSCGPSGSRSPSQVNAGREDAGADAGMSVRDAALRLDAPTAGTGGSGGAGGNVDAPVMEPLDANVPDTAPPVDTRPPPDTRIVPMTPPAPALGMGAVAYWPMDEATGNRAHDATGAMLHATAEGGDIEWVPGRHLWAVHIRQGVRLKVEDAAALDDVVTPNAFTITAWVYPIALDPMKYSFVLSRRQGTTDAEVFGLGFAAGKASVIVRNFQAQAPTAAPLNKWMHLAATYDGLNLRLYVDGAEANVNDEVYQLPMDTNAVYFGAGQGADGTLKEFIDANVDEVRLYKRVLTPEEIGALAK